MNLHILVEDNQESMDINKNLNDLINNAIELCLKEVQFEENCELNVIFVEDEEIRNINKESRNIDKATDVLSFPMAEFQKGKPIHNIYDKNPETDCIILGDIFISTQRALFQAKDYGHKIERELIFLLIHGMFHILGYDHIDYDEETEMKEKQERVLSKLNLTRS
jgi:probable rRNA maturation factor